MQDMWLMQEAAQYIAEHMHGWSPQTIANIVWAYGKLNVCHHVLMSAAAQSITSKPPCPPHLHCCSVSTTLLLPLCGITCLRATLS